MGHRTESMDTKEIDVRSLSSSNRHTLPYVHKVGVPPKQNLWKEFSATLKETFFSDDPLRSFKDQSRSRKFVLGMQAVFPILSWGRSYNLAKLKGDLIAGLTIASLCIPQDIGYSKLANLSPQYGLSVTDIDTSGIHALEELYRSLQKRSVQLVLANPGPVVIDKLHASSFTSLIGEDKIFLTVADAVLTCSPKFAEEV